MKINKKLHSVVLASIIMILFLIMVSSTALAASSSVITETRITTHGTAANPDIYGDKIVWQDNRAGNWDIYIFDLSAKTEIHTTNKTDQINPAIYKNLVVWEDERNGGHDIYMEDLSTKTQTRITKSGKALRPKIYDNRIVWMDGRNGGSLEGNNHPVGNWDIYMYDLSTSKEYQITTNNSMQMDPDIYKDKIVWHDERNMGDNPYEHVQIYLYNLSTSVKTPVNYGEGACFVLSSPRIYGDKIVWMAETVGTNYNIYIYDLSSSTLDMIGSPYGNGYGSQPDIYGNRIVWSEGSMEPGNIDIMMYDLSTSTGTQITTNGSSQTAPAIYGDRIVWQDDRNGNQNDGTNYDIYMGTLSESEPTPVPPVANFAASPISGKAPLNVKFTDKSSGSPTSWKWDFGDGTSSTLKNSAHTYNKAGKYTVRLTVKSAAGTNTKTIKDYITVKTTPVKPVAAFSATPTSGYAPLKVQFTDKSTGSPTSWKWSFGDGKTSTSKSSAYTYSKAGKYTVSLTVKNAAGSSTKTITNYITVKIAPVKPVAAFSGSPTSGKAPLTIKFTDKSTGSPTSWKWSFGDKTYSTDKNPAHKYSKVGKYTVSLTVKNAAGSSTKTVSSYVIVKK
jgi:beta propeller repeat protein